jgi:uncharacterized protein (TIGR00730 family)
MKKPIKAYNNIGFLNSPNARTLRFLAEYLEPATRFRKFNIEDTVVFFGSTRIISPEQAQKNFDVIKHQIESKKTKTAALDSALRLAEIKLKTSKYYTDAVTLASMLTKWSKQLLTKKNRKGRRFIICSGGGPGIMEAANRGASEAEGYSIGLNVSLPLEQEPNPYISKELAFEFHYFFIRKFWFVYLAKALIVFPGGFGTMDEMMELLTLLQTRKITKRLPVVLYSKDYWENIINFQGLIEWGMIDPEDLELFHFSDSPEDAFNYLRAELEKLL